VTLFVDSSVFYAAADRGDRSNARAKTLISTDEPLITTDHVVIESWLLIQRRMGADAADRFWAGVRSASIGIEVVELVDLESAWSIGQVFGDQRFSIVDRTSFAVLQRVAVDRVASFDSAFAVFRFGPRRDRAFEIVA
jgi:predicted nucleic acid-binding protein